MSRHKIDLDDRYQNQPWYIKLWRCRYLIPTPFYALKAYLPHRGKPMFDDENNRKWSYKDFLSMEIGMANIAMRYYYTSDEVREEMAALTSASKVSSRSESNS